MTNLRLLACLLASFLLAPAFAQSGAPTPRELYERAAFAEEHDHDLAAAEKGYRETSDAATRAGDQPLAKEAGEALARVLERQGKAPARQQEPTELFPQAQRLIAEGSILPQSADELPRVKSDLLVFGRALVPVLERMLTQASPEKFELGDWMVTVNPSFAADVLTELDFDEALKALSKGLESPDPLVRKAVTEQLSAHRQRDLLVRAAVDPVPAVRQLALQKLSDVRDTSLGTLMLEAARGGEYYAHVWLARHDPMVLLELVDEGTVNEGVLQILLQGGRAWNEVDVAMVERLAEINRSGPRETVRSSSHWVLDTLLSAAKSASKLDSSLENALLREIEKGPTPDAISRLRFVTPQRGLETAIALLESSQVLLSEPEQDAYFEALNGIANQNPPVGDIREWLRAYQGAARRTAWEQVKPDRRIATAASVSWLQRQFERDAYDAEVLTWFQGSGSAERERYSSLPASWLGHRMARMGRGESSATIDRSMLPVIAFVLDSSNDHSSTINGMRALIAVGEASQFERCLDEYAQPYEGDAKSRIASTGDALARLDPSHASEVLDRRIRPLLGEAPLGWAERRVIEAMEWLPAAEALGLFRELWTEPMGQDARIALLYQLIDSIEGQAATALVLELYPQLPPDGEQTDLRQGAIKRFAEELYEPAIPLLEEALKDPNAGVRFAAREASEAFKQQRQALEEFQAWTSASQAARDSIDELKALLADSNRDVVLGAVKALAAIKGRTALPELVKLLARDDAELKAAVQTAIDRIGE